MRRIVRKLVAITALTIASGGVNAITWEGYIMDTTDDFDGITTYRTSSEMWPMDSGYVALEVHCSKAEGMQLALRLQGIRFSSAEEAKLRIDDNPVAEFLQTKTTHHRGWIKIHLNDPSSGDNDQLINQLRAGNSVALRVSSYNGSMSSKIRLDGFTAVTNDMRRRCS